ncbi:MAG TPA: hypothetical protein VF744_15395 [Beijerinckiaceae bacterium]|jgi:hypothetical protein
MTGRFALPALAALAAALLPSVPASGEDAGIYAFIHSQRGYAPERAYAPPRPAPAPAFDLPRLEWGAPRPVLPRPRLQAHPRHDDAEEASKPPTMPLVARPIGEIPNPVPALLADKTLRPGDIVVFPDGPRVFRGDPGERHALRDFVKITSPKTLPPEARKMVTAMLVGRNDAWSSDVVPDRKLAAARRNLDVDATGSTRKGRRSRR